MGKDNLRRRKGKAAGGGPKEERRALEAAADDHHDEAVPSPEKQLPKAKRSVEVQQALRPRAASTGAASTDSSEGYQPDEPQPRFEPEGPLLEVDDDTDGDGTLNGKASAARSPSLASPPPAPPDPDVVLPALLSLMFSGFASASVPVYVKAVPGQLVSMFGMLLLLAMAARFVFFPSASTPTPRGRADGTLLETPNFARVTVALVAAGLGMIMGGIMGSTLKNVQWDRPPVNWGSL